MLQSGSFSSTQCPNLGKLMESPQEETCPPAIVFQVPYQLSGLMVLNRPFSKQPRALNMIYNDK